MLRKKRFTVHFNSFITFLSFPTRVPKFIYFTFLNFDKISDSFARRTGQKKMKTIFPDLTTSVIIANAIAEKV